MFHLIPNFTALLEMYCKNDQQNLNFTANCKHYVANLLPHFLTKSKFHAGFPWDSPNEGHWAGVQLNTDEKANLRRMRGPREKIMLYCRQWQM